jgi:D-arabinose 1-dehydrogenase-like Zn-dependent alcohol dehydrogenase
MRAAVLERVGEPLHIRELPVPKPEANEVLVQIKASGVCFTDIKVCRGLAAKTPLIPGHEAVGIVARVGEGVHTVREGERVAVHSGFPCGQCRQCQAPGHDACTRQFAAFAGIARDGGYADYMIAPAEQVVVLPDSLSFVDAAPLLCAGLTTFSAFRNAELRAGQRVAVVGIGGLGHLAVSLGAALGAQVYAVTSSLNKVADAQERGAVFAGSTDDVAERLAHDGGAHLVFNTAESLTPLTSLLSCLTTGATIVLAAGTGEGLPVTPDQFIEQQLRVSGTFYGSKSDLSELLDLAVRNRITPQTESYSLDEINSIHQRLRDNAIRYRAVVEP